MPDAAPAFAARPWDSKLGGPVYVEILRGKPSAEFDEDWCDLLRRADEPNVFMQPSVLRAAPPDRPIVALLAWEPRDEGRRLSGFWAFAIGTPHLSIFSITALCAPATEHVYLAAPVIDRDRLETVLPAMLDAIAAAPDLPKVVALESMSGSGPTYDALMRVLAQRNSSFCRLDAKNRPMLMPGSDSGSYLEKTLSSSSRKKLRQHRRRLGEKGQLQTTVVCSEPDVRRAFESFLALELKGWKGRRGTALLSDASEATFARNMVAALAQAGDASIHALELDGCPVSMQVVLRAGPAAFTWKTAYDEALSDFSPGMLLFEDYSKAFLADPSIAFADSCAYDDSGYMAAWTERKRVIDLWIDARCGGSGMFSAIAHLQKAYLPFRERAKKAYLASAAMLTRPRPGAAPEQRLSKLGEDARSPAGRVARAF
jgi:hypothetical protein